MSETDLIVVFDFSAGHRCQPDTEQKSYFNPRQQVLQADQTHLRKSLRNEVKDSAS